MLDRMYTTSGASEITAIKVPEITAPAVQTIRGFGRSNVGASSIVEVDMGSKWCPKCEDDRPIEEFCKNKNAKDGLSYWCRGCRGAGIKDWRTRHREKIRANDKRWQEQNPEKCRVKSTVYRAIKRGDLVRPDKCDDCNAPPPIQSHHDDYEKPLEVRWLCRKCHTIANKQRTFIAKEG